MVDQSSWNVLDQLLAGSQVIINRPKGSTHPRYTDLIYPQKMKENACP
jgi:inorganic pyrophosphatase